MSDAGIDFMNYYWIVLSVVVFVPLIYWGARLQSDYLRSLARQAEALERIAATLEKRG